MNISYTDTEIIKDILKSIKTIAMVGVSGQQEEVKSSIRRRPSIIVMKYLQEFGYKVIPVNPFSAGKEINNEKVYSSLEEIKTKVDLVNVFRPSKETPSIAKQAVKIGAKNLWLQYGIENDEAREIANQANIKYVSNKCIKQEYQKIFLKMNTVFPVVQ